MKKEEFIALSISKQVELVNSYLAEGKSMIDIFKRERIIELDESIDRKRFIRNGYKHENEKNKYVLADAITEVYLGK